MASSFQMNQSYVCQQYPILQRDGINQKKFGGSFLSSSNTLKEHSKGQQGRKFAAFVWYIEGTPPQLSQKNSCGQNVKTAGLMVL